MKLKGLNTEKKIFLIWVISYLGIFLISAVVSISVYFTSENVFRNMMGDYNELFISSLIKETDSVVAENNRIRGFVAVCAEITDILKIREPISESKYNELKNISNKISNYRVSTDIQNNFYIYLKNIDKIVSNGYVMDAEAYFKATYGKYNVEPASVRETIIKGRGNYIWLAEDINSSPLLYVEQLPIYTKSNLEGMLVVENSDFAMRRIIQNENKEFSAGFAVFGNKGQNVISSPNMVGCKVSDFEGKHSGDVITFNGTQYIYQNVNSVTTQSNYITLISLAERQQDLWAFRYTSLFVVLAGGILVFIMIMYFHKKNYKPMKHMISGFLSEDTIDKAAGVNGYNIYSIIDTAFARIGQKNIKLMNKMEKQKESLRNGLFFDLLKNSQVYKYYELKDKLAECGMDLKDDNFIVVMSCIEDFGSFFSDGIVKTEEEKKKTINYAIKNVMAETVTRRNSTVYSIYSLEFGEELIFLVNFPERSNQNIPLEIKKNADFVLNFFKQEFDIVITMSLSNVYQTINGISLAYRDATFAMNYKFLLGRGGVIETNSLKQTPENGKYSYSFEREQRLINCIQSGDDVAAVALVKEIFSVCFEGRILPLELARCLAFDIMGTLLKLYDNKTNSDDKAKDMFGVQSAIKKLFSWQTIDELEEATLEVVSEFCIHKRDRQEYKIKQLVEQYIYLHFDDVNLNVNAIAEGLGLNSSYLSSAFKQQTGVGILEYLNKCRLEKARTMLETTHLNVEDIALAVGYTNRKTFARIFKQYTGITAIQYREMTIERNNNIN